MVISVLCVVWTVLPATSLARIPAPDNVPLDRLLTNAEAFISSNPSNAQGYYTLGRIHQLAFSRGLGDLPMSKRFVFPPKSGAESEPTAPFPPEDPLFVILGNILSERYRKARILALKEMRLVEESQDENTVQVDGFWEPEHSEARKRYRNAVKKHEKELDRLEWMPGMTLSWNERFDHAENALQAFRKAISLDSETSSYPLGLASLAEDLNRLAFLTKKLTPARKIESISKKETRSLFQRALVLSSAPDNDWKKYWDQWSALEISGTPRRSPYRFEDYAVFYEASKAFIRNASEDYDHLSRSEKSLLRTARLNLAARIEYDEKHPGAISPVIFSFAPFAGIADLLSLDASASVAFDIAGYGGDHRWPWVKPTTGFLVWDPTHYGKITSGRQMFGTYTFGIPWENGYRALAVLDDNGDGVLTGSELQGLGVWFDRNSDGVSESSEILPVEELGIVAIAVQETNCDGIHPTNPNGIILSDGTRLRTWDWRVAPLRDPKTAR